LASCFAHLIHRALRTGGTAAARRISFEDSLVFERIHEQVYRELGFDVVDVPAGPLADRVALILRVVGRSPG